MGKRGKFIVVDGCEGAGKSSVSRRVVQILENEGHQIIRTFEPGGSAYADKIRRLILMEEEAKDADAETMFALFWAARRDHLIQMVEPALEQGFHVICDRFDSSTWAYQICGQEQGQLRHLFWQIREHYIAKTLPNHYLFFDIPPEVGIGRIKSRNNEPSTHFDQRDIAFHARVRNGFLEFKEKIHPIPYSIIDAGLAQAQVESNVLAEVRRLIA